MLALFSAHNRFLTWLWISSLALGASRLVAEVRLHPIFSDHAVLQRGMGVPVWGKANEGEKVTVEFAGHQRRTIAKQGHWMVEFPSLRASTAGTPLRVTGATNTVTINDVVVGEVWICSGQSNMEWPLNRSFEPAADIEASANPSLRLFTVTKRRAASPQFDLDYAPHAWVLAGPETVPNFSAVGYYFGRDLAAALRAQGVPVGIIHTSWGGSPAEVWMREGVLEADEEYRTNIVAPNFEARVSWKQAVKSWEERRAAAAAKGETFKENKPGPPWRPAELYNGMLANIIPYGIRGAIWYQGESNAGRAGQYRRLFADMIRNWREDWHQGDFWFLAVQLAPWDKSRKRDLATIAAEVGDSNWAELREAQNYVAATLPHVDVAVITDVGDKDDIHPTKKAPVGERLARLARAGAYGEDVVAHGPRFKSLRVSGDKAILRFRDAGDGLKTLDGTAPTGFTLAGADQKFHPATATVSGRNEVTLTSADVPEPVSARYGWNDYPVVNLLNSEALPASPFRTDTWPLTTQPK